MTLREAIAICRQQAERCDDVTGTALRVCARLADYHLSRQAAKKKRRRKEAEKRQADARAERINKVCADIQARCGMYGVRK